MGEQLSFDFKEALMAENQLLKEEIVELKEKAYQVRILLKAGLKAVNGH